MQGILPGFRLVLPTRAVVVEALMLLVLLFLAAQVVQALLSYPILALNVAQVEP
jgi:hypothetical protein